MGDVRPSHLENHGIANFGSGTISLSGNTAVGRNARVEAGRGPEPGSQDEGKSGGGWEIGVITALSVEMGAILSMLGRYGEATRRTAPNGQRFYETRLRTDARRRRVVATQALRPGQASAMEAARSMRAKYSPNVIVLVGIAGGIHDDVRNGDVVIANEVICYDQRKETPSGPRRRGRSHPVPAAVMSAANDLLLDLGHPPTLTDPGSDDARFNVRCGPIGSGEAVIAHYGSDVRTFLSSFNDKTLAVETEAAGLAEAFFEAGEGEQYRCGWAVVRGICDQADFTKDDSFHLIAARRAAITLEALIPHLTEVS